MVRRYPLRRLSCKSRLAVLSGRRAWQEPEIHISELSHHMVADLDNVEIIHAAIEAGLDQGVFRQQRHVAVVRMQHGAGHSLRHVIRFRPQGLLEVSGIHLVHIARQRTRFVDGA